MFKILLFLSKDLEYNKKYIMKEKERFEENEFFEEEKEITEHKKIKKEFEFDIDELIKAKKRLESYEYLEFVEFVRNLPLYNPEELYKLLEEKGYRGQERARKMVCVLAYRHLKRIKMLYEYKIPYDSLPEKTNYIFIGPTGCGKTFIIQLLFGKILKLPYIVVDITKYSETGYVGENITNIPYKLIESAKGNKYLAQIGVIVIDEFDKIAGSQSNLRFAGAGTTKDVSGYGVQRELLKLLEPGEFEYGFDIKIIGKIDTSNILFVGIGAFSGFKEIEETKQAGFLKSEEERNSMIPYKLTEDEKEDISRFYKYGFLPELIARFQRIITFEPLDRKTMEQILEIKISKIKKEFKEEGFELELKREGIDFIIERALKKGVGARGIDSFLIEELEKTAFRIFGKNKKGKIRIGVKNGKLFSEVIEE